jgi:hypothetical protein
MIHVMEANLDFDIFPICLAQPERYCAEARLGTSREEGKCRIWHRTSTLMCS